MFLTGLKSLPQSYSATQLVCSLGMSHLCMRSRSVNWMTFELGQNSECMDKHK